MMKKIILFLVTISLFSTNSFSQFKLGLTPGVVIPVGNLSDAGFGTGFGATLTGEYLIAKGRIGVGANLGYYSFAVPSGSSGYSFDFTPVTALFRYYIMTERFKPFVGVDAGVYISTVTIDYSGQYYSGQSISSSSSSSSNFGVAPVAGFLYGVSKKIDLGLNVKYNTVFSGYSSSTSGSNSASFLGINIAAYYTFGGK